MTEFDSVDRPLRVAIIGSGPAGFYTAEHLNRLHGLAVEIDIFDRLPTPYGLVRTGVAPDHPKIKTVTRVFDRIAANPNIHFYGNVEYGKHIGLDDLKRHYHQIVFATGTASDRRLDIPGIDLKGSHSASEFVAWYNGHPDYRDRVFDLSQERVAVIGVGNVAIDVARILCRTAEELRNTDIADHALTQLRESNIKEVFVIGRRGPAQAAFTAPEISELGELADADVTALPDEVYPTNGFDVHTLSRAAARKVELLKGFAERKRTGKSRKLTLRFLVSPVELLADQSGKVRGMRLVKNIPFKTDAGTMSSRPTDHYEELPLGLVFRSIGYQGVRLADVPFNDEWGVIHNQKGRVIDLKSGEILVGLYAVGWIKRGPTGVIGTNKPDAVETVESMFEDFRKEALLHPLYLDTQSIAQLIRQKQPDRFTYDDWLRIGECEVARGGPEGRPRVKFTRVEEMLAVLGRPGYGS